MSTISASADQPTVPTSYFVTGANRGLGLGLVASLLAQPDQPIVVAGARSPQSATALNDLVAQYPGRAHVIQLDMADKNSIKAAARWVDEHLDGRLDVLINNAGVGGPITRPWHQLEFDEAIDILQVNTVGPLVLAGVLLPALKRGSKKQIINISSNAGSISELVASTKPLLATKGEAPPTAVFATGFPVYRASKVALNTEVVVIAADLAPLGFTVVAIHPGWVATDMGNTGAADLSEAAGIPDLTPTLTTQESVDSILKLVQGLEPKDSGSFLAWDGSTIAW